MTTTTPRIVPFGDRALLVRTGDVGAAHALAKLIDERRAVGTVGTGDEGARPATDRAPGRIEEVVVGFASVLVVLGPDPVSADLDRFADWLARVSGETAGGMPAGGPAVTHVLPVAFDGPDLTEVSVMTGLRPGRVVELLVGADLRVAFVGFAPGFPYLTGLPPELAALPRRATPRTSVPAGSVAVAGGFASVYPRSTPGGWHLLGRTGEVLFDPDVPPHSRAKPGDRVRFVVAGTPSTTASSTPAAAPASRPLLSAVGRAGLEVVDPGLLDLVQDDGRPGAAGLGVPRSGAADPRALAVVNLLLGNDPAAAGVECTGTGPSLRVAGDGHIAVLGAAAGAVDVRVDRRSVPDAAVVPVRDGQVVSVGTVRHGLRAYVGVAGGLATPLVLGSRSSDVLSGLGVGALRAGDRLARGVPGRVRGRLHLPAAGPRGGVVALRVLPGPDASDHGWTDGRFDSLVSIRWRVGADADRVGLRLEAPDGEESTGGPAVTSTPMVTGAVQLPPDGRPIVLLPDHATVGGYPVVACVVTADLWRLGQLVPGDTVAFVAVDRSTATAALVRARAAPWAAVSGWYPTTAAT